MSVKPKEKIYPVDPSCIRVVFVVRQFIIHPKHNQNKTGHSYRQSQYVKNRKYFIPKDIPYEKLQKG